MLSIQILGLALLAAPGTLAITNKAQTPQLNVETVYGCYSDPGDLKSIGTDTFTTRGKCAKEFCKWQHNATVAATMGGNECYCGDKYPPKKYKLPDEECNIPCVGYPDEEACGGVMKWTVYNTGFSLAVVAMDEPKPTRAGGTGTDEESPVKTVVGETVVVTQPPKEEKSSNTGAIAGGVVVGVLAVTSLVGGILFYLRRKRNREIEEEHRRNAAVNSFTGKTPSLTDARLDPVMAQRRMSDGSIADNHDYSRKILRVTNA